jgi:hypothetical protein
MSKIDNSSLHLMRLCARDQDSEGWTKVSRVVWPAIEKVPTDLMEKQQNQDGSGRVRLTAEGNTVILWV